jgi:hypothetical protein
MTYAISLVHPESRRVYNLQTPERVTDTHVFNIPYSYPEISQARLIVSDEGEQLSDLFDFQVLDGKTAEESIGFLEGIVTQMKDVPLKRAEANGETREELVEYACKVFISLAKKCPKWSIWQVNG